METMETMELYAGMDLHSRNAFVGIMDKESKIQIIYK